MQSTPTSTPGGATTGERFVEAVEAFQGVLTDLAASQGRAVASLVLVAVLVSGVFVLPAVVGRGRAALGGDGFVGSAVPTVGDYGRYVPTSFAGLLLRTAQLNVAIAVVTAFLVVWGVVDVAAWTALLVEVTGTGLIDVAASVIVVALAFVASERLQRWIAAFSEQVGAVTDHQVEILLRLGQVAVFLTAGATILGVWNVDLSGLLIGAGFLGIVVGFAARKTLGSLIAGFVLMFSRPFTIGDWVEIGDNEGIVTDITVFNTRLENFDGEFIMLPNDQVSDSAITNRSKKGLLRLRTDVGIDYEADPERARTVAREALADVEEVADNPVPQVIPREFGDSAVVLELRYWIDHPTPPRKWRAVSAVVSGVKSAFEREDIAIPFPQRTVSGREGAALERESVDGYATGAAGNGHEDETTHPDGGEDA